MVLKKKRELNIEYKKNKKERGDQGKKKKKKKERKKKKNQTAENWLTKRDK